jgi:Tol biopolymer transport system component
MNADGSDLQEVTTPGGQAAYTPNGDHLVYTPGDPEIGHGIFLVLADGSDAPGHLLADPFPESDYGNPEMSPDGQTVTFNRDSGVFAVDVDGTDARMLVSSRLFVVIKHDWAPDGSRIVIRSTPMSRTQRDDDRDQRYRDRQAYPCDRCPRSVRW